MFRGLQITESKVVNLFGVPDEFIRNITHLLLNDTVVPNFLSPLPPTNKI